MFILQHVYWFPNRFFFRMFKICISLQIYLQFISFCSKIGWKYILKNSEHICLPSLNAFFLSLLVLTTSCRILECKTRQLISPDSNFVKLKLYFLFQTSYSFFFFQTLNWKSLYFLRTLCFHTLFFPSNKNFFDFIINLS